MQRNAPDSNGETVAAGIAVDSTFFIGFTRRLPAAMYERSELERRSDPLVLPTSVIYEVLAGVLHSRSRTEATRFGGYAARFQVAPLDITAAERAA